MQAPRGEKYTLMPSSLATGAGRVVGWRANAAMGISSITKQIPNFIVRSVMVAGDVSSNSSNLRAGAKIYVSARLQPAELHRIAWPDANYSGQF